MWLLILFYVVMLLSSSSSNPVVNSELQDETDAFYNVLRNVFDGWVGGSPSEEEGATIEGEVSEEEIEQEPPEDSHHAAMPEIHDMVSGLNPLYPCDTFEATSHTCTNVRQIGTTLTLGVQIHGKFQRIRWYRYFKRLPPLNDVHEEFTGDSLPWNINIGGESNELRISPITEIDFSFNYFVATVSGMPEEKSRKSPSIQFIKFVIEPINIDMGSLYAGEELVIYSRAFMELPATSVVFRWSLSGSSDFSLPSNMKVNRDGSSVVVKELRSSADRVLTCAVFSARDVFLARRGFLFRKIEVAGLGHPNFVPHFHLPRKKRSLDENEGFEDDGDDSDWARPRQTTKLETFDSKNPIEDPTYQKSDNQDLYNNDHYERKNFRHNSKAYPQGIKRKKIRPDDKNTFRFSESKPFKSSQQDEESEDTGLFSDNIENFQSHPEKSPIEDVNFNYNEPQYNSRSKKDFNRPWLDDATQENDQLDNLIQQANLLVKKTTEKNEDVDLVQSQRMSFDDQESALISDCKTNSDCSIHATCLKRSDGHHFCRCFALYKGNGIFCWLV